MSFEKLFCVFIYTVGFQCLGVTADSPKLVFYNDLVVPENSPVDENKDHQYPNISETVNTTILMTFNDYFLYDGYPLPEHNMGYEGFVYGFQFNAYFVGDIKISIWRWIELISDEYFDTNTVLLRDIVAKGAYTLVGITDTIRTSPGWNFVYLNESWRVQPNDFLGLTFGGNNPIPFGIHENCWNNFSNILQTCSGYQCFSVYPGWEYDTPWYYQQDFLFYPGVEYYFPYIDHGCTVFSMQALLMPDSFYSHCKMIQLTSDYEKYEMKSHDGYGVTNYDNDVESCWLVRAADESSFIHVDLITFDVEYADNCVYDRFFVETEYGNSEYLCGTREYTPDVYISPGPVVVARFSTDYSATDLGFLFHIRSIDQSAYSDYLVHGHEAWPWLRDTTTNVVTVDSPTDQTSTAGQSDTGAATSDSDLARKIGIGIGASVLCLVFIIGCIVCCCMSSSNKKEQKVHPQLSHQAPVQKAAPYPQQMYAGRPLQPGVYTVPEPRGPSNRALPPLSTGMSMYPTMPRQNQVPHGRSPVQPPQAPEPYPKQRYAQPLAQNTTPNTPLQPNNIQTQPLQPAPTTPPKHSFSTVAYALLQPKPLKGVSEPFGGMKPKTEEEMMALGRARLNWRMAVIPGPATYIEPQQWRHQTQGPTAGVPIQQQNQMFAEEGIAYDVE